VIAYIGGVPIEVPSQLAHEEFVSGHSFSAPQLKPWSASQVKFEELPLLGSDWPTSLSTIRSARPACTASGMDRPPNHPLEVAHYIQRSRR
jgi:hypothetical protein